MTFVLKVTTAKGTVEARYQDKDQGFAWDALATIRDCKERGVKARLTLSTNAGVISFRPDEVVEATVEEVK